jgi:gamma-glutamylcyclotransferase (GGCT)/AIG2-like uncharacterized protein YtfP
MMDCSYLFVYGSLRRGARTEFSELLNRAGEHVGMGTVPGQLFQVASYPGMVSSRQGGVVLGEVFEIKDAAVWPVLDEYEGCGPDDPLPHEFERSIVPVKMQDGRTLDAWVYLYCLDTSGKTRIESGDYLQAR